jgi:hypothetical protein
MTFSVIAWYLTRMVGVLKLDIKKNLKDWYSKCQINIDLMKSYSTK